MGKVTHFEMPFDDLERAKKFYDEVFGWKFQGIPMGEAGDYTMAHTAPTDDKGMIAETNIINGAMIPRETQSAPIITMTVEDINASLEALVAAGGEKLMDPQPVGDFGIHFYGKDSEGNVIGVWQDAKKPEA